MEATYFAPAERADDDSLRRDIDWIGDNPIVNAMMRLSGGLVAVLNEHRQILRLNDAFLRMLGIDDPWAALGLRPGEAVGCAYVHRGPGGCGTAKTCANCGAAIAIVSCQGDNQPTVRNCALRISKNGLNADLFLNVRACPLYLDKRHLVLLFLRDNTREQQWATLEKLFFHDISNMIQALLGRYDLFRICEKDLRDTLVRQTHDMVLRLASEITVQRSLFQGEERLPQLVRRKITTRQIVENLIITSASHPAARGRRISPSPATPAHLITTDVHVLERVLTNMIVNALEATEEGGEVRVWCESGQGKVGFCVWNASEIPAGIRDRIFQRNFSTKHGAGRGIGTFSIRYFGERILGGTVSFTSSREDGTVFRLELNETDVEE